jgi:hypothetical protein
MRDLGLCVTSAGSIRDEIDFFFIVDGDLTMYPIPSRVIAGRVGIIPGTYSEFIVGSAAFFVQKSNRAP